MTFRDGLDVRAIALLLQFKAEWLNQCMKIFCALDPNIFLISQPALPIVGLLSTLALVQLVSSSPADAIPPQQATAPRTFADWCLDRNNLSVQTRHTVDALLQVAQTTDCHQASKLLSTRTALSLNYNQITDLKPLSTLTNLTELFLINNQITDLRPLSSLTNLIRLYAYENQIADLKPLSTLTNLTFLFLDNNQITDIKPLSTLTNLAYLYLDNNQITDIKPLSTLTNLTNLHLADNQITDLRPLSTLTKLTFILLNNNSIADLKPLSTFTNLTRLDLYNNPSLTDKTCPVKPASTCRFVPEKDQ